MHDRKTQKVISIDFELKKLTLESEIEGNKHIKIIKLSFRTLKTDNE